MRWLVGSLLLPLLLAEFTELGPWLAAQLARRATLILPIAYRARYEEEWLVEVGQLPGRLFKIAMAGRIFLSAPQTRQALRGLPVTSALGAWWQLLSAKLWKQYRSLDLLKAQTRALLDGTADGALITDRFGRVTDINHALQVLTGWTEGEAKGRPHGKVLVVEDNRGVSIGDGHDPLPSLHKSSTVRSIKVRIVNRSGDRIPVAVRIIPIRDEDGWVVGSVIIVRDLSREREIEEVTSAVISAVSHELRSPLTMIHGFAELLVMRDMPTEQSRSAAEEILGASQRLTRLIEDLLSVSRMESGRLVLDCHPLDLRMVIERTLSPFRAIAPRHILRVRLPAAMPVVWGDADKIEQILTNLVGNAIKYSPGGGEVVVAVENNRDSVQISVQDYGIGISHRDITQVFEKFYRVDREEVRRASGTGLGLYITKRLVEMHGGRIRAESWLNTGSVFTFSLPLEQLAPRPTDYYP